MANYFLLGSALCHAQPVFETDKTSTGLTVVTMESHKVPLVTILLAAKAGGFTESPDIDGLTHLWEHMFFKGNQRLPDQEAFKRRIRQLGITYNGDTSAETVRYYFTMPSVFLEDGIQFMADAISTPLLDKNELKRERVVVLNEYDRAASNPGFDLRRLRKRIIYGNQAHRRDPLGKRGIIENASVDQLKRIQTEVFVPANSALFIAGDFDKTKIKAIVEKHFKNWKTPKGWKPVALPPMPAFPKSAEVVMTNPNARNVTMHITFNGPRARSQPEDSFAIDVLISLLNQRTGRFYKKFIDSGLTLNAGLGYQTQSQAGEIVIYAITKPESAKKTKTLLTAEIKEWLKPDYFTKDQLEDVRRQLLIDYKRAVNKPSEYVKGLGFWWTVTGLDYYGSYIDSLRKTELSQVRKAITKYLVKKPAVTSILLNKTDAKTAGLVDNSAPYMKKFKLSAGAH